MDDFEKALEQEIIDRKYETCLKDVTFDRGARWAKEWLMNIHSVCPSCGEEFVQLVQDPETNRLNETAIRQIDRINRLEKHIKILRKALKALPRLNQKRGYPTGPEWQFLLDICDQALSDCDAEEQGDG